jgi:hypothetical protein
LQRARTLPSALQQPKPFNSHSNILIFLGAARTFSPRRPSIFLQHFSFSVQNIS